MDLMGQLDSYSLFYEGLKTYTGAVDTAYQGAHTLKVNMDTLAQSAGKLNSGIITLASGVKELLDGATQMKDGTTEFLNETTGANDIITNLVDNIISSISGSSFQLTSFVSSKNENINAVQFVIQTEAIVMDAPVVEEPAPAQPLTFWQKLLRLFGLY
jgi:putative membrane protein